LAAAGLEASGCGLVWGAGLDTFRLAGGDLTLRTAGAAFASLAAPFGGPRRMIAVACASSTQALGEAAELVRRGRAEACVAGGSSVMLTPFYLVGFARLGAVAVDRESEDPAAVCRPFDLRRQGFALAEGAAALVVESWDSARRRGAAMLAELAGFGTSQDAFDLNRPPPGGAGAELAMRRALDDAGLAPGELDAVNAHGTATLVGDQAEAAALRRLLGERWRRTPVSSAKGAIGHAMAAAGALEAVVACRTCATGLVPPTVNLRHPDPDCDLDHVIAEPRDAGARTVLSLSLGMGGQNAAVVLRRVEE
jgi:3-oxoacyl-[acyl-carrier-protein] synthase II